MGSDEESCRWSLWEDAGVAEGLKQQSDAAQQHQWHVRDRDGSSSNQICLVFYM